MDIAALMSALQGLRVNGRDNYGVYMPKTTQLQSVPKSEINNNAGVVYPFRNQNKAYLANDTDKGYFDALDTMFHEAAHTVQPKLNAMAEILGFGSVGNLAKNTFEDYDNTDTPPASEALATLRAHEAMQPTGKTIWDERMGRDYLAETMRRNPQLTSDGARRVVEHQMFPEHSLLSDGRSFQSAQPSLSSRLLDAMRGR